MTINELLSAGFIAKKIETGSFETYYIYDLENKPIAIFKPIKFQKEEATKEIAAYLLDHEGFARVPKTEIVKLYHPLFGWKRGSYHTFSEGKVLDVSEIPHLLPEEVRRIAILDLRLLNLDRHGGNLLLKNQTLVPIDHHLVLPLSFFTCYFAWSDWEQSKTPFSEMEKEYILKLDPEKDRRRILELGLPLASANLSYSATQLLQEGVKAGLTAYDLSLCFEKRKKHAAYDLFKHYLRDPKEMSTFVATQLRRCF
jgi:hypothetical protein